MTQDKRGPLTGGLHLAVLWSLAIAKPLFDVLDGDPGFFVARSNTATDLIVFALGVVLIPPALMLALELLADLIHRGAGRILQLGFVALLAAALAMLILKGLVHFPAGVMIALALAAGAGFAVTYSRGEFVRTTLTVLSPAPLLFAFLFLFASPVADLVNPPSTGPQSAQAVRSDHPLVVVFFDELPLASLLGSDGHIDAKRYPNFAELEHDGDWYRNATTVGFATTEAVPALLSGEVKPYGTAPILADYPDNLFTELSGHYAFNAHETVTHLCPSSDCPRQSDSFGSRMWGLLQDTSVVEGRKILPDSLADHLPDVSQALGDFFHQSGLLDDVGLYHEWVKAIGPHGRTLNFFHLRAPHAGWRLLPDGEEYPLTFDDPAAQKPPKHTVWVDHEPIVDHFWQRHLLQTGFTDLLLGELISKLKSEGIWRKATVIVTADHGGAFYPGDQRRVPTENNLAAIAPIPMFVKRSGQEHGRVIERHFCTSSLLALIGSLTQMSPAPKPPPCSRNRVSTHAPVHVISLPLRQVQAQFRELLAHQQRVFGTGSWGRVYGYGPYGTLVGTRVSAHPRAAAADASVELDPAGDEREFVPGMPIVPALVQGDLDGEGIGADEPIAVAVNGTIEGVGTTYDLEGELGLAAMIPPRSLLGGGKLTIFRIRGSDRLQPIPIAGG